MTEEVVSSTSNNNNNKPLVDENIVNQPQLIVKKKKKQGAFSFLKAASLKLRRRPLDLKQQKISQEAVPTADSKGDNWKKLMGSMRPLHLQDNQSPPSPHPPPPVKSPSPPLVECCEHFSSPSPSTSSAGTMSQYASANNLQELYGQSDDEEEEDPDQVFDAIGADEMIDAKAENFIARFYEEMKRQQ